MNDIKLFIGKNEPLGSKIPWLPTLDSVLTTQQYVTSSRTSNKSTITSYLYRTIIIFRTATQDNYNYEMLNDMLYTNSNTDYLTQHLGTDEYITMDANYFYFDGNYYYSYLVMYSNEFDKWNVINNDTIYAVWYDQSSVTINGGTPYIMNEHRITKNVIELLVTGGVITNIEKLILPNKTSDTTTFETYSSVTSCKKFQLFDEVNEVSGQLVNTLNGLLYSVDYTTLLAVPVNFQMDGDGNLILPNYVTTINSNAFSISEDDRLLNNINILRGDNVTDILDSALIFLQLNTLYMPKLKGVGNLALQGSIINQLYLPNTLYSIEDDSLTECLNLKRVYLQYNIEGLIDLRGAVNILGDVLSIQLYNVKDLTGLSTNYIYLASSVYDSCTADSIKHCEDLNWTVVRL